MIPGVSESIAAAIASKYSSFRALTSAYSDSRLSRAEKQALLQNILKGPMGGGGGGGDDDEEGGGGGGGGGGGRTLIKVSQNVYEFFSTLDADAVIGKTAK